MNFSVQEGRHLDLGAVFTEDRIIPALKGQTKREILDELIGRLLKHGAITDGEVIRRRIMERENLETTALNRGVAFPHARAEIGEKFELVMGRSLEGIDYGAPDGQPVRLIFLAVWQPEYPGLFSELFGGLIEHLRNPGFREELLEADTAEEIAAVLSDLHITLTSRHRTIGKASVLMTLQQLEREKRTSKNANIRSLTRKINLLRIELDEAILHRFDRMIGKDGTAVVEAKGGCCQSCFMNLSVGFQSLIKRGKDIYVCENCGRFIIDAD